MNVNQHIAFIGGGNMARSLIGGLIANGLPATNIHVAEPIAALRTQLAADFGVHTYEDSVDLFDTADCVILAVKPQVLKSVIEVHAQRLKQRSILLISIAAGISQQSLSTWTHPQQAIVRTMPNTPALLQLGATGLHANDYVNAEQKALAEQILNAVGITLWVNDESLLDSITAISGSGPAYFFAFIEAMQDAAQTLGLNAEAAQQLIIQTALGAAQMAKNSDESPSTLRERVTSKGGTTAAALASFEQSGLNDMVNKACTAARDRSIELSKELS